MRGEHKVYDENMSELVACVTNTFCLEDIWKSEWDESTDFIYDENVSGIIACVMNTFFGRHL